MHLKHLKTLLACAEGAAKITALAWSPTNLKLAAATSERVVVLFDDLGEKRDKFSTKPADAKFGKKSYVVKGLAFSPDGTKLAVGQTDNIVFVYKLGEEWGEKKVICNKFAQSAAVTAIIWPIHGPIIVGLADGKVRAAVVRSNKASTLYGTDSYVVSLTSNVEGTGFLSGHADGSVIRWFVTDASGPQTQGKLIIHNVPPYALGWTSQHIVIGGSDKKLVFYSASNGALMQQFDYFNDESEKELGVISCSPSGQAVCVGSFNRIRVYSWAARKNLWEEHKSMEIDNLYTVTALAWKRDGSRLCLGSLCGGVELFESVLRRSVWRDAFEVTYVGPSQVLVRPLASGARGVILKSVYGHEIEEVRIMGNDNYIVARTSQTLLLGDLKRNLLSEIDWRSDVRNEKFYFDNATAALIFRAGELALIEYGQNEILGVVRTEFTNPHLISVRINERKVKNQAESKRLAYLLDLKTIVIDDLVLNHSIGQVSHDSKIDWLELNETARKLLFRDKKQRLHLVDLENLDKSKTCILNFCSFVQWVPGSDVVVAQARDIMAIWYNIEAPERVTHIPIKGDIVDIIREDNKTEVLVQENNNQVNSFELDEGLIEFATAIDDGDYLRAIQYLESLQMSPETETMWATLAKVALEARELHVSERCYAALGDVSKAKYLRETLALSESNGDSGPVLARLHILEKQFKAAEAVWLDTNNVDEALHMYTQLYMYDDALALAEAKAHPALTSLRTDYREWLLETGQEERAGSISESEGDLMEALNLFLRGGLPTRATKLILNHPQLLNDPDIVQRCLDALARNELWLQQGELFEKLRQEEEALESYVRAESFNRALDLARRRFPQKVVALEEQWGDYLVQNRQLDAAINHYIEAGKTLKALDAALDAKQWKKAVQIIQVVDSNDNNELRTRQMRLGEHFSGEKEFALAQRFFLQANQPQRAIDMYNKHNMWEEAHALAQRHMEPQQVRELYIGQAKGLEAQNRLREAEKLYVSVQEPDLAIGMYKKHRQYDSMTRLVQNFHPELLQSTHSHLAQELEQEGNFRMAEKHFVEAGEWKTAVHMYRNAEQWEEAYRVAQSQGGPHSAKQVAFLWAKSLGGESAVRLLTKFNVLDQGIDFACESYQFDFAFELAKLARTERLVDIHYKCAMALEDEGKFEEAEQHFVQAKKPKEAVLMYVHNQDWSSAQRVAELHEPNSVKDVLIGEAKVSFESGDFSKFESLLLRAQRPDLAVKQYKENQMWVEALRVAKDYLPDQLNSLQTEYDKNHGTVSDMQGLIKQGRQWEESNEYERAVEAYAKVGENDDFDEDQIQIVVQAWLKAADLATKFLDNDKSVSVAKRIGPRLVRNGRYNAAAQLYLGSELVREAVDALIEGEEWSKAKRLTRELEPELETYVDAKYKEHLKKEGQTDQLANVDLISALDLLAEQGQWDKTIEMASQNSQDLKHKYVALYVTHLIRSGSDPIESLRLFRIHGSPKLRQNFNIYRRLAFDIFELDSQKDVNANLYQTYSQLRDLLYDLIHNNDYDQEEMEAKSYFEHLLLLTHYLSLRSACQKHENLKETSTKISVSLLRYTDVLPADKFFFEAGTKCREMEWLNMAFVFLNRYLDLYEAIEEKSLDLLDPTDLQDTDIPSEIPLPERPHLDQKRHEEVKEWVLAISMDQKVEPRLPVDERMVYVASLSSASGLLPACVVCGYPVREGRGVEFGGGMQALEDEWNKLVMVGRTSAEPELQDVLRFVKQWCGLPPNLSFR